MEKPEELLSDPDVPDYRKEFLKESLEGKRELEENKSKKLVQLKARMGELDGYVNLIEEGADVMDDLNECATTISRIGSRLQEIESEIARKEDDIDLEIEAIEEEQEEAEEG